MLLLVIVAAVCSGLLVGYWPMLTGSSDDVTQARLETLETRVGQLAAGHAGDAAAAIFGDMRKQILADEDRIAAAEARLSAVEHGAPQTGNASESAEPGDVSALRAQLGALNASLSDVTARLAKIEGGQTGQPSIADLAAKLSADEARLAMAETANTNAGSQTAMLASRVQTLEANTPPDLPQKLESFALKTDASALDARLMKLEAVNSAETLQRAATLLSLSELSRAAAAPQPFTLEMKTYANLAPDDPAVAVLSSYAARGVPTRTMLAQQFSADAENALDAEREAAAGGFFHRLWANIKGLVTIRRVGNVLGADSDATLARAGAKLDAGDFAGAVSEVRTLNGVAAKAMQPWRDDAQARLAVDTALADADARIVSVLAAARTTTAPQTSAKPAVSATPAAPPTAPAP
jgi:hypothetical protein